MSFTMGILVIPEPFQTIEVCMAEAVMVKYHHQLQQVVINFNDIYLEVAQHSTTESLMQEYGRRFVQRRNDRLRTDRNRNITIEHRNLP